MPIPSVIQVHQILQLHDDTVSRWHGKPIDNPYEGFQFVVCRQHSYNFLLWHEEDAARSPDASDAETAQVKRTIDKYNQLRNDWIEKIDDWVTGYLVEERIAPSTDAGQNTETIGAAIDRLSILALRIYHLAEQCARRDVDDQHRTQVGQKLSICQEQRSDLAVSLAELIDAVCGGRKRHKTYRQLKMYNDPALNPYLYQAKHRKAG
jgi:hypothetical protein